MKCFLIIVAAFIVLNYSGYSHSLGITFSSGGGDEEVCLVFRCSRSMDADLSCHVRNTYPERYMGAINSADFFEPNPNYLQPHVEGHPFLWTELDLSTGSYFETCVDASEYLVIGNNTFSTLDSWESGNDGSTTGWIFVERYITYEGETVEDICDILISDLYPSNGGEFPCNVEVELSLEEVSEDLASRLESAVRGFEDLKRHYSEIDEQLPGRIAELESALEFLNVSGRSFEDITGSMFTESEDVVRLYEGLIADLNELTSEPSRLRSELQNRINPLDQDIDASLNEQGVRIDELELEQSAIEDYRIIIPEFVQDSTYSSSQNIYDTYAGQTLSDLEIYLDSGNNSEFIIRAKEWLTVTKLQRDVLIEKSYQSPQEWLDFTNAYVRVEKVIFEVLDEDFWFKDSPVSSAQREAISAISNQFPAEGGIIESEVRTWRGQTVTEEQLKVLKTIEALGNGVSAVVDAGGEVGQGITNLVQGAAIAVKEGVKCAATIVVWGDFGDLYEIILGESICTGEKLTAGERMISSLGLVIGNGTFWRGVGRTIGIIGDARIVAHMTADVLEKADKLGLSEKELDEIIDGINARLQCSV